MKLLTAAVVAIALFQTAFVPTFTDLANATYNFGPEDKRVIELKDGQGSADYSTFELMKLHAIGDLDGDKQPDAAAMVAEDGGGSGHFYYLFVFLNKDGKLMQIEHPEWLGDRSVIQRVAINRGVLSVRFVTHRDSDPACCPTRQAENKYRVVGGKLVGF